MQNQLIHTAQTCSLPTRSEPSRRVREGWGGAFLHTHYNTDLWKIDRKEDTQTNQTGGTEGSYADVKTLWQTAKPSTPIANPGYNYKFNGMEMQEEFGTVFYDFGARNGACPERSRRDPALGRWMNVDPLSEKYYSFSPYTYTANNPIYFIDPDGKQIDISFIYQQDKEGKDVLDKQGNRILTGVNINITGKLINFSNNDVNMDGATADINSYLEETFSGMFNGVSVNTTANITTAESMEDVSESDHLFVLAEPGSKNPDASGAANSFGPGKVAFLDADYFTGWWDTSFGKTGQRTATHEFGHLAGLKHPPRGTGRGNIMVSGGFGNSFTISQLGTIIQNYEESNQAINYGADGLPNMGVLRNEGIFNMTNTQGRNKTVNKSEYFKKAMQIKN